MILLKAATVALNVAFAGFITLLVTKAVSAWQNYTQRVENAIKQSQEAVQAADQLASSLKELENSYEELGDKSGWSSEDSDQAQDIQEQILELLKEQNGIAQDQIDQIDLQNGKYEDQLKLIRQIRLEQLRDEESDLIQNKDNQGKSLTKTAKKQANDVHSVDSYDSEMAQELADKFGWSYDADAGVLNFNNYDQNDPESVAKHYDELGQAIDIITKKYSDAERASSGLYDAFKNDRAGIKDQVEAYRDSSTAIDNNISKQKELETILALTTTNARAVRGAIGTLANSIQDFDANKLVDLLNGNGLDGLNDAQLAAIDKIKEFMTTKGFNTDQIQSFVNILSEVGFIVPQTADAVEQASQKIEDISSKIDEIQTAYKNATTAIEEYNKYGYLSADTLQTLLNEDFEYLSCLELVDGQLQVNTEKYQSMIAAQYQSAAMALVEKANAELAKIAQGEKKDAVEDATKATEDQATALTERVCPALGEFAKASMTAAAAQEFLANGDAAWSVDPERTKEVYAGLASGLDILDATVDQIMGNSDKFRQHMNGFDKETKNRNKNTAKSVTDVASAFDTLNKAMKEYNQYGYLCADTAKSLVSLDDKFTACLTKQGDKLQINIEQFRKFVKEQLKEANAAKDGGKSADEMNKILNYLDQNVDTTTISFEQLTDAIKGYGTAMDEAKEKTNAIKSAFSDLYDVGTKKKDNDFGFLDADSIEKKYQAIRNLYDKTDLFTNPAYKDALNPETGEINYDSDAFRQMFADHLAQLATSARKTGGEAGEYLAQGFEDAAAKIANNVMSIREYIDGIGSSLNYATDRIDHFQSGFSDISDIVNEYNTYGGLSIDNYQKLMSLDDDYIKCLSLEEGQLKFNTKAYKDLFVAKLLAMADEYDKAKETAALAQRLRELAVAVEKSGDGFTMAADSAKNFEDTLSNIKSLLSDLIGVFEKFNTDKSNDLKIQGDAWLEVIDKRIDALNEANDAQERAIELQKAQDALAKAEANKTVHVYHANGTGFEWEADQNAVRDAQSTLNDTIRNNRKEDELDRLNKLKEAVQKNNELIGSSFEDYEKKKKYLAEFDKMTYDQMIEYNDTWKDSILGNMKSTQTVTNVNNVITSIEKLLSTLQTLNNVLKWIDSAGASTDGGGLTGLFSNGGLLSKVGKFFNIASKDGLGAALNKTGEWFSRKLSATLEANPNNPIIKAFSNIWTKVGEGASTFFNGSGGTGLGGIVKTGIKKVGTWLSGLVGNAGVDGILGDLATKTVTSGGSGFIANLLGGGAATAAATGTAGTVGTVGAATAATAGTAATTASSAIPIIGPIIAVAVNNAVQQFGKISKKNTEIWADQNSSTGEKIVKSIGNVLYHLSPVEGWDLAAQYAEKAANGDGI